MLTLKFKRKRGRVWARCPEIDAVGKGSDAQEAFTSLVAAIRLRSFVRHRFGNVPEDDQLVLDNFFEPAKWFSPNRLKRRNLR